MVKVARIEKVGWSMRRRLRKFLPIVLFALMVQVLAPIAACWAAVIAASDPLYAAQICGNGAASTTSQTGDPAGQAGHHVHDAACCLSCATHCGASADTREPTVAATPYRRAERVVWRDDTPDPSHSRAGSHAQARAPPFIS
jgi:hypothetical protein